MSLSLIFIEIDIVPTGELAERTTTVVGGSSAKGLIFQVQLQALEGWFFVPQVESGPKLHGAFRIHALVVRADRPIVEQLAVSEQLGAVLGIGRKIFDLMGIGHEVVEFLERSHPEPMSFLIAV